MQGTRHGGKWSRTYVMCPLGIAQNFLDSASRPGSQYAVDVRAVRC